MKLLLSIIAALLPALTFTANGQGTLAVDGYTLSYVYGTYSDLSATINSEPWWGNPELANSIAASVRGYEDLNPQYFVPNPDFDWVQNAGGVVYYGIAFDYPVSNNSIYAAINYNAYGGLGDNVTYNEPFPDAQTPPDNAVMWVVVVPEPTSLALTELGCLCLLFLRRRK